MLFYQKNFVKAIKNIFLGQNVIKEVFLLNDNLFQVRTDLAIDVVKEEQEQGYVVNEEVYDSIKVTTVNVDLEGSEIIGKKPGIYITIDVPSIEEHDFKESSESVISNEIQKLIKLEGLNEESSCLVIGLGNDQSTPDSLGPKVVSSILVTKHIFDLDGESIGEGFREVSAIKPGVMGQTGIETSEMIYSIVEQVKPDFLIVIDALASSSIERIINTIQMTNTGIHPGSGVGNKRKEISKEVIGIPVIAIGVPTVCDAVAITSDTIDYILKHFSYHKQSNNKGSKLLKPQMLDDGALNHKEELNDAEKNEVVGMLGSLDQDEKRQLIKEVLTPIGYNLMVTPKSIDFSIEEVSGIISRGIDLALHNSVE